MTGAPAAIERLVMLGADHRLFERVSAAATRGGRSALATSPGAVPEPRFWASKGNRNYPNEDACCVVECGATTVLAVADAHFGRESSHALIQAIAARPPALDETSFDELLHRLAALPSPENSATATTLVVAVIDRASGEGRALCFGDSRLVVLDRVGGVREPVVPDRDFVRPGGCESLLRARPSHRFACAAGDLVIAYTDGLCDAFGEGVGVEPARLRELAAANAWDPLALARAAGATALAEPSPGAACGRDNLAIAVTRA
ncbi:MAG: SpoIIE family protein phosphatase [Planctomycetes bacterium]|nr:SpoIIE family protein phosphatase [Planctomycetota bacterium]